MSESTKHNRQRVLLVGIIVLVVLVPLGYSILSSLMAPRALAAVQPFLEMPDAKYTSCVRDTTFMRYHHWELLRAIREEVVRYGQRGEIGLSMCKNCHTSRERFCNRCHDAVSLFPDCYGCHYYP